MGFYSSVNDLGNQIENLVRNPNKIKKYAKNGAKKYFELFNNKLIAKSILDKTL